MMTLHEWIVRTFSVEQAYWLGGGLGALVAGGVIIAMVLSVTRHQRGR